MATLADMELLVWPRGSTTPERVDKWVSYQVNWSLFNADNFTASIPATKINRALFKGGGQKFQIKCSGALQFTGLIDERSDDTSTSATDLHVSGRDFQGLLMDVPVPYDRRSILNQTLLQIATRWTVDIWPEYIYSVVTNQAGSRYIAAGGSKSTTKVNTGGTALADNAVRLSDGSYIFKTPPKAKAVFKPFGKNAPQYAGTGQEQIRNTKVQTGISIWAALQDLAAQIGAHCWMSVDGALIISRPDYTFSSSAYGRGIELGWDRKANRSTGGNVSGVTFETSTAARFSEYRVTGVGKSKKKSKKAELLLDGGTIKDPGPAFWDALGSPSTWTKRLYKPGIIAGKGIRNINHLTRFARRYVCDKMLGGYSLDYKLNGHHAPSGALWTHDTTVRVNDERNEINDVLYIVGGSRSYSMTDGKHTVLKPWPTYVWLAYDDPGTSSDEWHAKMATKVDW